MPSPALIAAPTVPVKMLVSGGIGTGKSSVLAVVRAALRTAGVAVVTRAPRAGDPTDAAVVIDDAHLLADDELDRLVELVSEPGSTVVVAAEALAHHARRCARWQRRWNGRTPWCRWAR